MLSPADELECLTVLSDKLDAMMFSRHPSMLLKLLPAGIPFDQMHCTFLASEDDLRASDAIEGRLKEVCGDILPLIVGRPFVAQTSVIAGKQIYWTKNRIRGSIEWHPPRSTYLVCFDFFVEKE